jgi:hypothetical protein
LDSIVKLKRINSKIWGEKLQIFCFLKSSKRVKKTVAIGFCKCYYIKALAWTWEVAGTPKSVVIGVKPGNSHRAIIAR